MLWNELKKYNIEDIALYINEKLIELGSLKAIADILEVNESTIRKKLNSNGYKRINNQFVLNDDMFNQFVEDNKPFDKHDLMGQALLEYINKHKKD